MDPLAAKFDALRIRLRRVQLLSGLAWAYSITLLLLLGVCLVDWWVHLDPPLWRRIAAAAVIAVGCVLVVRRVVRPVLRVHSNLDLAIQIGRRHPGLRHALASAAEFRDAGCPAKLGSARLQHALLDRIRPTLDAVHPEDLLNDRRLQVPALLAVLVSLAAATLIASDQERAILALERIGSPATAPAWPRVNTLVLFDEAGNRLEPSSEPRRAPSGEPLRLFVRDETAALPEQIRLHVTDARGALHVEPFPKAADRDGDVGERPLFEVLVPELDEVVQVRVTGGDDQRMPWHAFRFTPRPATREVRAVLTPPDYSGRPVETVFPGEGPIEGLVGTRVRLELTADVPLRHAEFFRNGAAPQPLSLDPAGLQGTTEFEIEEAGRVSCWFALTGRDGLRSGEGPRFEVAGVADREPAVSIEHPAVDLTVTPQARLPMSVLARDDVGLREVRLSVSNPPGSVGESLYPLAVGPDFPSEAHLSTEFSIEGLSLDPGRIVQVRAEALDAWDRGEPHVARSTPRVLTVVSPAEKLQELQSRQTGIAQSLERALALQDGARQQMRELQLQWTAARELSNADYDLFKRAAADQQRVSAELLDERRGVSARAAGVIDELEWNQLRDDATVQRLGALEQELDRLRREVLPGLEQSLSDARKALSSEALVARDQQVETALVDAAGAQEIVSTSLALLLDLFAEWKLQFDLHRELASVVESQSRLREETLAAARETVAQPVASLTPQQLAALARLAGRQQDVARQLERLEATLKDLHSQEEIPADQNVAIGPALDLLRSASPAGDMRRAAQQIPENKVAEAVTSQNSALETLESLEALLRGIGTPAPDMLLKAVADAQSEAQQLRRRQADHLRQARELAESSAATPEELQELQARQQQLADDAAEMAQRLIRRPLGEAAAPAARAGRSAAQAAAHLQDDTVPSPAALNAQQDALDELLQTELELARARRQLEADRALAEMGELASLVEAYTARQQHLVEETTRLEAAQREHGSLSRSQLRTLRQLADAQSQLAGEVAASPAAQRDAPVLAQAFQDAATAMSQAASHLEQRNVGDPTLRHQRDALAALSLLGDALKVDQPAAGQDVAADPTAATEPVGSDWSRLVQLRLLITMQDELARRTRVLSERHNAGEELSPEERSALVDLARRQSELAEMAGTVLPDANPPGEEPPPP